MARVGDHITGVRHHDDCRCGCEFTAALQGRVIETVDGIVVAEFDVPHLPSGGTVRRLTAYTVPAA